MSTETILTQFIEGTIIYVPVFIAGLVLLIIGAILAKAAKALVLKLSNLLSLDKWLKKVKLGAQINTSIWFELVAEILKWSIFILFLVAAVETWGLVRVGTILGQLLIYLPNVLVAAIIGFIGTLAGALVGDMVKHGARNLGSKSANMLSSLSRYAIYIFTILLVLNQLGVAADLIRILFTGVVAMIALAGGLAFGLGGQDTARKLLDELYNKLK